MKLIIIRGLPGSGKSTFARTKFPNVFHIENDMFHYHNGMYEFDNDKVGIAVNWCYNMVFQALSLGMDVCVSNVFPRQTSITRFLEYAKLFNATVEIYRLNNNFGDIHDVPKSVYESMKNSFVDIPNEIIVKNNE